MLYYIFSVDRGGEILQVQKRDNTKETFNTDKVRRWVRWGVDGLENQIEKEYYILTETLKRLPEIVTTEEIHQTMISVCLDKEEIEYSRIASKLEMASIYKNQERYLGLYKPQAASFHEVLDIMEENNLWKGDWLLDPELDGLNVNDWLIELEAFSLEYWTVKQWADKYSIKIKEEAVETPAIGCLAIALSYHGVTKLAFDVAKDLITAKLNLPTPVLNGCRDGNYNSISCCLMESCDTIASIDVAEHIASQMTAKKAGIGITLDTRSKGDPVKGGAVTHLGKQPLYKSIETSVKKYTQITRGGSATMTYKAIDPDIMEMLMWKTQRIDLAQRIDKIDYNFAYNDAFVDAVLKDEDWYLFSRYWAPEVHDNFHSSDYESYVKKALKAGTPHTKVKAIDILRTFIGSRCETGRIYCINVTSANEHTPFNDTIHQSNLCVAPETQILTDAGYITISDYVNESVNVWNGEEFSNTTIRKTGVDRELITVNTDSGQVLECTPEHKFYVAVGYMGKSREVQAVDLEEGDKLIKLSTPLVQGRKKLKLSYENGFFSADGCASKQGDRLYFYQDKIDSVYPFIDKSTVTTVYDQPKHNRLYCHLTGLKDRFFVPSDNYTVATRLNWLAGYMDGDGCIYRNGTNHQMVASSIEKTFLQDIQLMLQTLGVQSKVTISKGSKGKKLMPNNKGLGEKEYYNCKQSWSLIITSNGLYKLGVLGFETNRLDWELRKPKREASHFTKITSVVSSGRIADTYCFTEEKRNLGVFNGLLTGQCMEIALPTKPYIDMPDLYSPKSIGETAFCSLGAANVANLEKDEIFPFYERALRTVDTMIERAPMMTDSMQESILRRKSVGIGITGLASALYKAGLDYDGSPKSLEFVESTAELHMYALYQASQKISKETGECAEGIDLDWLPIDTMNSTREPTMDWEKLRGLPRAHSVLVAHMPTESSAVFSNATNGVYPSRTRVIYKKARKGKIQFISEHFTSDKLTAWEVNLIPYYKAIQAYSDQAISADYFIDFTTLPNKKIREEEQIKWFIRQAKAGIKTAYYQNFIDSRGTEVEQEDSCEGGSCKL